MAPRGHVYRLDLLTARTNRVRPRESPVKSRRSGWETVHVFISSTFHDMHAERDYLVKQVFPRLYDWCERRKLRLVDVDLRWGVTEADATHNRNVVQVCLERIDQCRPFFVCFVGQRYGWIPQPQDIDDSTFAQFPGLADAVASQHSVTDLEVLHAAVRPFQSSQRVEHDSYRLADHTLFYLRDDGYLASMPTEPYYLRRIYTDTVERDGGSRDFLVDKQRKLREETIPGTGRPFRSYTCEWLADHQTPEIAIPTTCPSLFEENKARWRRDWQQYGDIEIPVRDDKVPASRVAAAEAFNHALTRGRLGEFKHAGEALGDIIFDDLTSAIERRYPDHTAVEAETQDDLQTELDQQEQFLFVNSEGFIRRGGDFDNLDHYVRGDSNRMLVLTGDAGMGKSMLLANWVSHYRRQIDGDENSTVHCRFIGASDASTSVVQLLQYLMREMAEVAGKIDEEIPDDPTEIRNLWRERVPQLGARGKTVLVIDALNQLESGFSDLRWLPAALPDGVKLIISFRSDDESGRHLLESYKTGGDVIVSSVRPFDTDADRRSLVREYLRQYLKELDEQHTESLIRTPGAGNPLYLKVVLSELHVFGSFASLAEKIASGFGDTPQSAFDGVLQRLESDPAYRAVTSEKATSLLFGFLAHARRGLSVEELRALAPED